MDRWDGETYRRVLVIDTEPVEVAATQTGDLLRIEAGRGRLRQHQRHGIAAALERLLGLHVDLNPFYSLASRYPRLNRLAQRFRGVKPPRFPSLFEALVNGITCQQLSLTVGITVLNRLVALCGARCGGAYAFPEPSGVLGVTIEQLRALGYSRAKGRALLELARDAGPFYLEQIAEMDNQHAVERLLDLRGVGRWTAEYALLRGIGRTDVFPGDDVGARNNLERWLKLRSRLDYEGVRRTLRKWQGFGGLVYFHLLLDGLDATGYLNASTGAAGDTRLGPSDK